MQKLHHKKFNQAHNLSKSHLGQTIYHDLIPFACSICNYRAFSNFMASASCNKTRASSQSNQ